MLSNSAAIAPVLRSGVHLAKVAVCRSEKPLLVARRGSLYYKTSPDHIERFEIACSHGTDRPSVQVSREIATATKSRHNKWRTSN